MIRFVEKVTGRMDRDEKFEFCHKNIKRSFYSVTHRLPVRMVKTLQLTLG